MELLLLLLPQLEGEGLLFTGFYNILYRNLSRIFTQKQQDLSDFSSRILSYIFSFRFQFLHLLLKLLQYIISKTPLPSGCRLLHAQTTVLALNFWFMILPVLNSFLFTFSNNYLESCAIFYSSALKHITLFPHFLQNWNVQDYG